MGLGFQSMSGARMDAGTFNAAEASSQGFDSSTAAAANAWTQTHQCGKKPGENDPVLTVLGLHLRDALCRLRAKLRVYAAAELGATHTAFARLRGESLRRQTPPAAAGKQRNALSATACVD